jgi:hypothetical protein
MPEAIRREFVGITDQALAALLVAENQDGALSARGTAVAQLPSSTG